MPSATPAGQCHDGDVPDPSPTQQQEPQHKAQEHEPQHGVGQPDAFARLWTPHRMAYIKGGGDKSADQGCPFDRAPHLPPDESLVVARGTVVYAVLNLYPYNPGHLMVCPYRHVADYTDLTDAVVVAVASFTQEAMRTVRRVSGAHGFNIGLNQGSVAGAGIAAHLHQHVVPRWGGDANFLPIIGRTKALPELLGDTRQRLADAWPQA